MVWNTLAALGLGLGIGAVGGWLIGRSQLKRSLSTIASANAPASPPAFSSESRSDAPNLSEPEDLKAQLQQAQLAYEMAREMAQFKAGFLARAAHELRSPINSVISLHQLILSDLCDGPKEERDFIAQADAAAQRMLALLDKLIGVAKTSHGTEQLQIQPVSLEDVLMEVQSMTYLQARNRNIQLEIEFPDSDPYVLADPKWLRQVLISLVDTPIALMQEGTVRLTSQIAPEAEAIYVWIEDQRPASAWSEPLELLHASKAEAEQGSQTLAKASVQVLDKQTGQPPSPSLNLLINQTLMELMGGQLNVLAVPSAVTGAETASSLSRIQCTIPWVPPEDQLA